MGGYSSTGRALDCESRGWRFDPLYLPKIKALVVHNFRHRSRISRWTPQKNLLWLFTNSNLLALITWQILLQKSLVIFKLENNYLFQLLLLEGFKDTIVKRTSEAIAFKNYPVSYQFPLSLRYWITRTNWEFFSRQPLSKKLMGWELKLAFNIYYKPRPYFLTRSTQKTYKVFLTKFLLFLSFGWVQWNRLIRIRVQHTQLLNELYFLTFLNVYYFKIYNF